MARKILNTYPVFTVSVGPAKRAPQVMTREQAEEARAEFALLLDTLQAGTFLTYDVDSKLVEDARCEHCNGTWTAESAEFNSGCCDKDEANDPQRLADLRTLAEAVEGGTFYRYEDGQRGPVAVNWPDTLGSAVCVWLDAGRPASEAARLVELTRSVKSTDWCTLWQDPGPSDCSLPRQPDRVSQDIRPTQLADELLSLIDDMGLLPARRAA